MSNQREIQAVLFDMDDTLIDWSGFQGSWRDIEQPYMRRLLTFLNESGCTINGSDQKFIQVYGENVQDAWIEARRELHAPHMGRILMQTLAEFGVEADDTITMKACLKATGWRGVESVTCFPDVPGVLRQLQDEGYILGILTNAFQPMWLRDAELERYNLLQYFPDDEKRMSAADIGYLKPHPEVFRHALEKLGTSAEETIYIGDNPVADISGAQGVGMRAVLRVNHGNKPPLDRHAIEPDAIITSFHDLPPLLETWNQAKA
jgi:FMN phosphatase YigB (HAD superfamily)